jgi:acetoin utilization deacetylase AcuC-like enzyme
MRIVYDPRHRRHRPRTELLYGKPVPHPEQPERVEAIRDALRGTRWEGSIVPPRRYDRALAERVHELAYLDHLRERSGEAASAGPDHEWFPYTWPHDRSLDTGTPVMGNTLDAAWRSACVALTAADALRHGERAAFALCRPPGHHASAGAAGGYCYLNNAAIAAAHLLEAGGGEARVAILDLDIHHGNGTQEIFYASSRVLYCSIHGHPDWAYPPHTGYGDEQGVGLGAGYTFNQPLPEGTGWPTYSAALERALERIARFAPQFLIVSQGFDTFEGDRWGGFHLHADHFGLIGGRLRAAGAPLLIVLEGGYEPANLAAGSLALLQGLGQ